MRFALILLIVFGLNSSILVGCFAQEALIVPQLKNEDSWDHIKSTLTNPAVSKLFDAAEEYRDYTVQVGKQSANVGNVLDKMKIDISYRYAGTNRFGTVTLGVGEFLDALKIIEALYAGDYKAAREQSAESIVGYFAPGIGLYLAVHKGVRIVMDTMITSYAEEVFSHPVFLSEKQIVEDMLDSSKYSGEPYIPSYLVKGTVLTEKMQKYESDMYSKWQNSYDMNALMADSLFNSRLRQAMIPFKQRPDTDKQIFNFFLVKIAQDNKYEIEKRLNKIAEKQEKLLKQEAAEAKRKFIEAANLALRNAALTPRGVSLKVAACAGGNDYSKGLCVHSSFKIAPNSPYTISYELEKAYNNNVGDFRTVKEISNRNVTLAQAKKLADMKFDIKESGTYKVTFVIIPKTMKLKTATTGAFKIELKDKEEEKEKEEKQEKLEKKEEVKPQEEEQEESEQEKPSVKEQEVEEEPDYEPEYKYEDIDEEENDGEEPEQKGKVTYTEEPDGSITIDISGYDWEEWDEFDKVDDGKGTKGGGNYVDSVYIPDTGKVGGIMNQIFDNERIADNTVSGSNASGQDAKDEHERELALIAQQAAEEREKIIEDHNTEMGKINSGYYTSPANTGNGYNPSGYDDDDTPSPYGEMKQPPWVDPGHNGNEDGPSFAGIEIDNGSEGTNSSQENQNDEKLKQLKEKRDSLEKQFRACIKRMFAKKEKIYDDCSWRLLNSKFKPGSPNYRLVNIGNAGRAQCGKESAKATDFETGRGYYYGACKGIWTQYESVRRQVEEMEENRW